MNKIKDLSVRIKALEDALAAAKKYFSDTRHERELEWFEEWVQSQIGLAAEGLDECPACHNNPGKVAGGTPCKRCDMIGMQPWGG